MDIQIIRCKHCGNEYNLQLSCLGYTEFNSDRTKDFCPECYAIIKDEVDALERKLKSKEMKDRHARYKHAYVKAEDITIENISKYCGTNWGKRKVSTIDGWGYERFPFSCGHVYVKDGVVYRKYLIDTKDGKVVTKRCPEPYQYRDDINECTTI